MLRIISSEYYKSIRRNDITWSVFLKEISRIFGAILYDIGSLISKFLESAEKSKTLKN